MGMTYLIVEMIALLAIACVIGFLVGISLNKMAGGTGTARERALSSQLGTIEAERNELQARLKRAMSVEGAGLAKGAAAVAGVAGVATAASAAVSPKQSQGREHRVADLPGVSDKALHMMRDVGIRTTYDLMRESEGEAKLKLLSTALEQETDQVREWRHMSDLLRVPGVDAKHAKLLVSSGVMSVDALNEQDTSKLHAAMAEANSNLQLTSELVDEATVAEWLNYASPMSQLDLDG